MLILKDGDKIPKNVVSQSTGCDGKTRCYFDDDIEVVRQRKIAKNIESINKRSLLKTQRSNALKCLTVTTTIGNVFNACEDSQNRMMRRIMVMSDADTVEWTLHDNSIKIITKVELQEALSLAVNAQSTQWSI